MPEKSSGIVFWKEKEMRKYNYIICCVMSAIAGYIFYETARYNNAGGSAQQNSASWPRIIAAGLIICSLVLLIQTLFLKEERTEPVIDWKSEGMKKVYIALGCILIFLVLNRIVGMLIAFLFLIPAIEWIMGTKNKWMYILLPVCVVGFLYVFFYLEMSVRFPRPFWG